MRRRIFLLAASCLGSILALAENPFWKTKDYHQWTKNECRILLTESPWAKTYRTGSTYQVQLRSALPVRQAIVRQMQLEQNYESFSMEQRRDFDARADDFLSRRLFTEMIVVRVMGGSLTSRFRTQPPEDFRHRVFLITSSNEKIPSLQYITADDGIDFVFPRQYKGNAIANASSKYIRFEFPYAVANAPGFTAPPSPIPPGAPPGTVYVDRRPSQADTDGTALIEFKVDKMLIDGQLIF